MCVAVSALASAASAGPRRAAAVLSSLLTHTSAAPLSSLFSIQRRYIVNKEDAHSDSLAESNAFRIKRAAAAAAAKAAAAAAAAPAAGDDDAARRMK